MLSFSANATLLVEYAVNTYVGDGDLLHSSTGGGSMSSTYNEFDSENKALASLSGESFLPNLKVKAQSTSSMYSRALAVQKFTYDGSVMSTLDLNFNLHGDVSEGSRLSAEIGIILAEYVEFYDNYDFSTNFWEGGYEGVELGYQSLGLPIGMDQNIASSLAFDIKPGESFFVYAEVLASAENGFSNGWNTLTLNFADDTGLTAASNSPSTNVPEPSTFVLMLSALILFNSRKFC